MKKILSIALVCAMLLSLAACGTKADEKSEGSLTYAEYVAAELDTEVTIEGFVQSCAYAEAYGNASLFLADGSGAYYIYRMGVTAEEAAKLTEGTKIKVTGTKSEWAGETEVIDVTSFEFLSGSYKAKAADVTKLFGDDDALAAYINQKVSFKGLTVEASKDADGNEAAFLYSWDGSGAEGSNSDLYFNVSLNGVTCSFTVESDEVAEGEAAYTAVTELAVGQTVTVEGYLYWYNGPQLHVYSVSAK